MVTPGWLSRCLAEVPAGERWLGSAERRVLAGLRSERRRRDWLLGRWTAKAAVGAWLTVSHERVQILAAHDGAPEAWLDGERTGLSLSLSHRAGRSLAVVADAPSVVGCDLELLEPRSEAFMREWLTPGEQGLLADHRASERARLANLLWAAKEAAAKVRREGLRLDIRQAAVAAEIADTPAGGWRALHVQWPDVPEPTRTWWRAEPGFVMTIAGLPRPRLPRWLG